MSLRTVLIYFPYTDSSKHVQVSWNFRRWFEELHFWCRCNQRHKFHWPRKLKTRFAKFILLRKFRKWLCYFRAVGVRLILLLYSSTPSLPVRLFSKSTAYWIMLAHILGINNGGWEAVLHYIIYSILQRAYIYFNLKSKYLTDLIAYPGRLRLYVRGFPTLPGSIPGAREIPLVPRESIAKKAAQNR